MKKIIFGKEARDKINQAVEIMHEAVSHTLGPKGGNTAFSITNATPIITNDGVSIAREISVKDPEVNIAIQLIKQAAIKANDQAGDGTTTSIVLTKAIFDEGIRLINEGANSISLRDGMNKALNEILETIDEYSTSIKSDEDLLNVASISAGSKELGLVILEAFKNTGKNGIVEVERGNSDKTYVTSIKGYHMDIDLKEELFLREKEVKLTDCYIFNTNLDFDKPKQLRGLLSLLMEEDKPCILIGNSFSEEVISNLLINLQRDIVCIPIEAPSYGQGRIDLLKDLEFITNSKFITKQDNLPLDTLTQKNFSKMLGSAKEIKLKKEIIIFTELMNTDLLTERANFIKENSSDSYRLSKVTGGISTIYTGGLSRLEVDEKYRRIEDAINATNSAIEEGIVPGGGTLFHYISSENKLENIENDFDKGYNLVYKILTKPLEIICKNSGIDYNSALAKLNNRNTHEIGLNAVTGEICNLVINGIIDPTKTLKSSLKASVSVASTILTTNCLIVDEEEKKNIKSFL